jgi:LmbE family N-acetylglucosaminyl deacetylase
MLRGAAAPDETYPSLRDLESGVACDTATILFLHAHPDDESILTGISIAKAKAIGWRVIVAYATRGDAGETSAELHGQTLGERREDETRRACKGLGVDRLVFLGYDDSGMADTETTNNPGAFTNADLDEVAERLVSILVDESIDLVVGYDQNGTYGHPDHVQIHRVAHHVAPRLRANWILDVTYNREYLKGLESSGYGEIDEGFASAEADLTHFVEGHDLFAKKVVALKEHTSQVPDDWNPEAEDQLTEFAQQFGTEWYIVTAANDSPSLELIDELLQVKSEWSGAAPS